MFESRVSVTQNQSGNWIVTLDGEYVYVPSVDGTRASAVREASKLRRHIATRKAATENQDKSVFNEPNRWMRPA